MSTLPALRLWPLTIHQLPVILLPYQLLVVSQTCHPLLGLWVFIYTVSSARNNFSISACLINYYPLRFISLWNLHWINRQAPIPGCQDLYDVSILGSHNPPPWTLGSYQSSFSPQMYTIHLLEKCVGSFPWNLFASINSFMLLGSCREAFPRPD